MAEARIRRAKPSRFSENPPKTTERRLNFRMRLGMPCADTQANSGTPAGSDIALARLVSTRARCLRRRLSPPLLLLVSFATLCAANRPVHAVQNPSRWRRLIRVGAAATAIVTSTPAVVAAQDSAYTESGPHIWAKQWPAKPGFWQINFFIGDAGAGATKVPRMAAFFPENAHGGKHARVNPRTLAKVLGWKDDESASAADAIAFLETNGHITIPAKKADGPDAHLAEVSLGPFRYSVMIPVFQGGRPHAAMTIRVPSFGVCRLRAPVPVDFDATLAHLTEVGAHIEIGTDLMQALGLQLVDLSAADRHALTQRAADVITNIATQTMGLSEGDAQKHRADVFAALLPYADHYRALATGTSCAPNDASPSPTPAPEPSRPKDRIPYGGPRSLASWTR